MTDDALRAAIAADCPHRLVDYDAQLAELDRQAQASSDPTAAKDCLEQASRIRHKIRQGLK